MAKVVSFEEIDQSAPRTVSVSATEGELSATRLGLPRRISVVVVPLSAGVTVTVTKGDQAAVANAGYVIIQNQIYAESDDARTNCWQGAYHVVASGAGSVSIVEVFERG